MSKRTVRVRITGRVQGVAYRAWTERNAVALGLTGWVRNRQDGAVEALFSGEASEVAEMLNRCWDGPPAAAVTHVATSELEAPPPTGFAILPAE